MNQREFILRKTPFVFLKRVAYITFFFALLPLAAFSTELPKSGCLRYNTHNVSRRHESNSV